MRLSSQEGPAITLAGRRVSHSPQVWAGLTREPVCSRHKQTRILSCHAPGPHVSEQEQALLVANTNDGISGGASEDPGGACRGTLHRLGLDFSAVFVKETAPRCSRATGPALRIICFTGSDRLIFRCAINAVFPDSEATTVLRDLWSVSVYCTTVLDTTGACSEARPRAAPGQSRARADTPRETP